MAGVRFAAHTRIRDGKVTAIPTGRKWTAEDYDLIEELIALGLRYKDMLPYFTKPPVTITALKSAVYAAKIEYPFKSGRPKLRRD